MASAWKSPLFCLVSVLALQCSRAFIIPVPSTSVRHGGTTVSDALPSVPSTSSSSRSANTLNDAKHHHGSGCSCSSCKGASSNHLTRLRASTTTLQHAAGCSCPSCSCTNCECTGRASCSCPSCAGNNNSNNKIHAATMLMIGGHSMLGSKGGAGAGGTTLTKGRVTLGQKTFTTSQAPPEKVKEKTVKKEKQREVQDMPRFKLLLLGDEGYEREFLIASLQDIVPDVDAQRAAQIFDEAQRGTKSLCGIFPQEQAELYVEQFSRSDPMIFADTEEE